MNRKEIQDIISHAIGTTQYHKYATMMASIIIGGILVHI